MICSITHRRAVGDTLTEFATVIKDNDGVVRDLTGLTVKFVMYDEEGTIVIPETAATVTDADAGLVEYDFSSGDVAVAGTYYGYFKVYDGLEPDTYPADDSAIEVEIFDPAAAHTTPDPSVISAEDIAVAAKSPRRVRTVEGTVEERSINDLIKADQYTAAKAATAVPWGMRIAKSKPPSSLG